MRSYNAVATRLTRLTADVKRGQWDEAEDEALRARHAALGAKWAEIGRALGRSGQACRDRWRVIGAVPDRQTGAWSREECDLLVDIVSAMVRALRCRQLTPQGALP